MSEGVKSHDSNDLDVTRSQTDGALLGCGGALNSHHGRQYGPESLPKVSSTEGKRGPTRPWQGVFNEKVPDEYLLVSGHTA